LKGRKSTSGVEMLDNLEDLEEKREALEWAVRGWKENKVPSDEDDGIPCGHESSYMAETYRSVDTHCA
jgi:hypothetical protein